MRSVLVMRLVMRSITESLSRCGLAPGLERVGVHARSWSPRGRGRPLGQHGVEGGLRLATRGVGGGEQRPPVEVVGVLLAERLDLLGRELVDLVGAGQRRGVDVVGLVEHRVGEVAVDDLLDLPRRRPSGGTGARGVEPPDRAVDGQPAEHRGERQQEAEAAGDVGGQQEVHGAHQDHDAHEHREDAADLGVPGDARQGGDEVHVSPPLLLRAGPGSRDRRRARRVRGARTPGRVAS